MFSDEAKDGDIRYLSVSDLIAINRRVILDLTPDEQAHVLSLDALEAAQQRPAIRRYYEQNTDLFLLAGVLFVALVQSHAFANGNKRTAFAATRMFLLLNGAQFDPTTEDAEQKAVGVALHRYDEYQIAQWMAGISAPIDCGAYLLGTGDVVVD